MSLTDLPIELLTEVLLRTDVVQAIRVSTAWRALMDSNGFREAWMDRRKRLSNLDQRVILKALGKVFNERAQSAAVCILAALRMVKLAGVGDDACRYTELTLAYPAQPDWCSDTNDHEHWCSAVAFEIGDGGAVISYTTDTFDLDESGEVPLNLHMHVTAKRRRDDQYDPQPVIRTVCLLSEEIACDTVVHVRRDDGIAVLRRLLGSAKEELDDAQLITVLACAASAWINLGLTCDREDDSWDSVIDDRVENLTKNLALPQKQPFRMSPPLLPGMALMEWDPQEQLEGNDDNSKLAHEIIGKFFGI
uniref:F-box domain-containing protein n=1 Tax=Calcidiscus leptoporus TaxID=127549 RepID=A0A7S0JJC9_9EUKA